MKIIRALYDLYTNPDYRGLGISPRERIANQDKLIKLSAVAGNQATSAEWSTLAYRIIGRVWVLDGTEMTLSDALDGLYGEVQQGATFNGICAAWGYSAENVKKDATR